MHVHVNVNVPEEVWSHALKAKFRKHGTNPCKQKLSGAILVGGEVAKSVEPKFGSCGSENGVSAQNHCGFKSLRLLNLRCSP